MRTTLSTGLPGRAIERLEAEEIKEAMQAVMAQRGGGPDRAARRTQDIDLAGRDLRQHADVVGSRIEEQRARGDPKHRLVLIQ